MERDAFSITIDGTLYNFDSFQQGTLDKSISATEDFEGTMNYRIPDEFFLAFSSGSFSELVYYKDGKYIRGLNDGPMAHPTGTAVYFIAPNEILMSLVEKSRVKTPESLLAESLKSLL